ncbi:hypothetical protein BDW72DRAFT_186463 [Aspergillus terricola var. indicus]
MIHILCSSNWYRQNIYLFAALCCLPVFYHTYPFNSYLRKKSNPSNSQQAPTKANYALCMMPTPHHPSSFYQLPVLCLYFYLLVLSQPC